MTARALVVEDQRGTLDVIGNTLVSLGHQYDVATNQEDARDKLKSTDYEYVLLDLHIPARRKRSFPSIDHGVNLLSEIRAIKCKRQIPVIVMTGHSAEALNMAAELLDKGATALISKPFPPTGKTLNAVQIFAPVTPAGGVGDACNGNAP